MTRSTSSANADDPDRTGDLIRRGLDALGQGQVDLARRLFRSAVAFAPATAQAYAGLLLVHRNAASGARTAEIWRALAIDPDEPVAAVVCASLLSAKAPARAARLLRRQICLRPGYGEAHHRFANLLLESGTDPTPAPFDRAFAIDPTSAAALTDKAIGLRRRQLHPQASRLSRAALSLDPGIAEAHNSLAMAKLAEGRPETAVIQARRGTVIAPGNAEILWNEGLARLSLGDWRKAWPLYEARWRVPRFPGARADLDVPRWDGTPDPRASLLLWAEQGLGDTLQFVRYARLVRPLVGRVILQVPAGLKRLLSGIAGVDLCVARNEALPAFDLHCPLGSLPGLFGTTLETVPCQSPYLAAPATDVAHWKERLSRLARPWIGVCWKGNPRYPEDRMRSPGLDAFRPVIAAARGSVISLVKDLDGDDLRGLTLLDLSAEQPDMATTAGIVANLDLVVTSDTFLPHLAGALGNPVWLLLHHAPDWRWLISRTDTPWYPSVDLFRQSVPGDWPSVVGPVAARLQGLC